MHRVLPILGLAGLLGACSEGSPGAMGQAYFSTDCAPTDQACLSSGLQAPIAKGATLRLDVALGYAGAAAMAFDLEPVDPSILQAKASRLTGLQEGVVALLVTAPGERVIDFIHVSVKAPTRIALHRLDAQGGDLGQLSGKVQLLTDDKAVLDVRPYDGDRQLLGEIAASWSATGDAVTLLDPGLGSRREVSARQPGTSRITVSAGGQTAHLDLEVLP